MIRHAWLIGVLAVSCAAGPEPASSPPVALVQEVEKPDEGPVREVMASFLVARWTYDADALPEYLSAEDIVEPWEEAMKPPTSYVTGSNPAYAHWEAVEFEMAEVEMTEDGAEVSVDVIRPTLSSVALLMMKSNVAVMRFVRWQMKDVAARGQIQPYADFMPDREIVRLTYRVRKGANGWKVVMGWPASRQILELESPEDREAALDAFIGSEVLLLRRAVETRHKKKLDPEKRRLVDAINKAEQAKSNNSYPAAITAYDRLIADFPKLPEFVLARRGELEHQASERTAHLAAAKLEFSAPKFEEEDDTTWITVKVTNDGPEITNASFGVAEPTKARPHTWNRQFTHALKTGESKEFRFKARHRGEKRPDKVVLLSVWFKDRDLQQAHPHKDSQEFQRDFQDFQTGGKSRASIGRVGARVRAREDALDKCPSWGEEPVDLRVEIDGSGQATDVRTEGSADFVECIASTVKQIEFDRTPQSRRAVVRLLPPTHWSRK
jgi:hypothetical protein